MMQKFCQECGAKRLQHHKFCVSCGEAFVPSVNELGGRAEPSEKTDPSEREPKASSEMSELEGQPNAQVFVEADDEISDWEIPQRSKPIWPFAILAFALIAGISSWVIWGGDTQSNIVEVMVSGSTNVRERPTTTDSKIVTKFETGKILTGKWVEGATNSKERWLEFNDSGRTLYVWEGNIGERTVEKNYESKLSNNVSKIICPGKDGYEVLLDPNLEFYEVFRVPFDEHKPIYHAMIKNNPEYYGVYEAGGEYTFSVNELFGAGIGSGGHHLGWCDGSVKKASPITGLAKDRISQRENPSVKDELAFSNNQKTLIKKYQEVNELCRGSNNDEACVQRDAMDQVMTENNLCYGKDGDYGYQMYWYIC